MGSHPLQAIALLIFLLGATVLCAAMALDGNALLVLVGGGAVIASLVLFMRCKRMEEAES